MNLEKITDELTEIEKSLIELSAKVMLLKREVINMDVLEVLKEEVSDNG